MGFPNYPPQDPRSIYAYMWFRSGFCPKCGTPIKPGYRFCPHCGYRLKPIV
jgi:predicted amidophosphoribosyltransferase